MSIIMKNRRNEWRGLAQEEPSEALRLSGAREKTKALGQAAS